MLFIKVGELYSKTDVIRIGANFGPKESIKAEFKVPGWIEFAIASKSAEESVLIPVDTVS